MKKVFLFFALLSGLTEDAQVTLNENGVYEQKEVVTVDGATATELYNRAVEALSDWTGTEGRSKFGIDSQDKESGTIIYKGKDYLGFRRFHMFAWYIFSDFTLKIRCKDGRAQVTVIIPSLTAEFSTNGVGGSIPLREILPEWKYRGNLNCRKAVLQHVGSVPDSAQKMILFIKTKLQKEEDDF